MSDSLPGYDAWLTHDPREDGPEPFCQNCSFRNHDGCCLQPRSDEFEEIVDDEHYCEEWELVEPDDDGDRKYDEMRDREDE